MKSAEHLEQDKLVVKWLHLEQDKLVVKWQNMRKELVGRKS